MLVVVVGATNGIGYYTALGLATNKVNTLILVGRSVEKGEIIKKASLDANPSCAVHLVIVELSLIANVRIAIKEIQTIAVNGIDILYNSAALCLFTTKQTSEGIEQSFVVNYLQRFLIIKELLPLLNKVPYSRIVLVAAPGKPNWSLLPLDLDDLFSTQSKNQGSLVLRIPIVCNDILYSELIKRLKNENSTTTISLYNPGLVNTGSQRDLGYIKYFFTLAATLFGTRLDESGDFPVKLAMEDDLKGKSVVYLRTHEIKQPETVTNDELGIKLWEYSTSLCDKYY